MVLLHLQPPSPSSVCLAGAAGAGALPPHGAFIRPCVCAREGKGCQTARRSSLHACWVIPLLPAGCAVPVGSWASPGAPVWMLHTLELEDPSQHTTQGKWSSGSACGVSWSSLHGPGMGVGSAGLQSKAECGRAHPVHPQLLQLSLAAAGGGRSQWLSQRRGVLCVCSKLPSASHPHQWDAPRDVHGPGIPTPVLICGVQHLTCLFMPFIHVLFYLKYTSVP